MKIIIFAILILNAMVVIYFLYKEVKKENIEEISSVLEESKNVEKTKMFFQKNIVGVFIAGLILFLSIYNKRDFGYKNLIEYITIMGIFNTLYLQYLNRILKENKNINESLKIKINILGNFILPIGVVILIIIKKLVFK